MESKKEIINEQIVGTETARRLKYEKPQLEIIGDVRSLTLGSSPGLHDSGGNGSPPGYGTGIKRP